MGGVEGDLHLSTGVGVGGEDSYAMTGKVKSADKVGQ